MIEEILDGRQCFISDTGNEPTVVYLTEHEMEAVGNEPLFQEFVKINDELEIIPFPQTTAKTNQPKVTAGCQFYGMTIAKSQAPGIHFSAK